MKTPAGLWAFAIAATAAVAHAETRQTTIVRAPIAAVAIGPTHASVEVNVNNGASSHAVFVNKPLIAVSTPFHQMHIRVN